MYSVLVKKMCFGSVTRDGAKHFIIGLFKYLFIPKSFWFIKNHKN